MNKLDVLFIVPGNHKKVFQGLGNDFAAIEPPAQAGLFASYLLKRGCSVEILDIPAIGVEMSSGAVGELVAMFKPNLVVMIVYGHQPSASTQNMPAARVICEVIQQRCPDIKILMTGTHSAALPERTLMEEPIDFVCDGEGPVTIYETLQVIKSGNNDFSKVSNLWFWRNRYPERSSVTASLIQNLDFEFSGISWDLLPMSSYRAHNWHCFDDIENRKPYAAIHTSFGCPFSCVFCCINAPFGGSSYRMFSPQHVISEIDVLVTKYGVKNIKFIDELFVLNEDHVNGICDLIIKRGYNLNIWAYARVDTAKEHFLEKLRKAGVRWLALGIESGSSHVRDGAKKRFSNDDVVKVARKIQEAGIYVGANYIFGLPDDTTGTMQETLDLALEINAEWANFYCAMAYPGSKLYKMAKANHLPLPDSISGPGWIGYSQYAYECWPLPTNFVSSIEVLRFRDAAFQKYFTADKYLKMMLGKFGDKAVRHIMEMTSLPPLRRKLLE